MNNKFVQRKNIRIKEYDYSNNGYYFITICTKNRKDILSRIKENKDIQIFVGNDALVVPSKIGCEVVNSWNKIEILNKNVYLDEFILMPNHIHGIIILENNKDKLNYNMNKKYGLEISERRGRRSLQSLIKDFKSVTTRKYKEMYNTEESLWQKSYYEHIIRNQKELNQIREYIHYNPLKNEEDY